MLPFELPETTTFVLLFIALAIGFFVLGMCFFRFMFRHYQKKDQRRNRYRNGTPYTV